MKRRKVVFLYQNGSDSTIESDDNPFELLDDRLDVAVITFYLNDVEVGSIRLRPLLEEAS